jgi:hypothetical protein
MSPLGKGVDLPRIGIEPDDVVTLLGEGHGQREPDIPKPHEANFYAPRVREPSVYGRNPPCEEPPRPRGR